MKKFIISSLIICLAFALGGCKKNEGDVLYEEGTSAYLDGDYQTALEKLQGALDAGVSDEINEADLYAFLGNSCLELSDINSAIDYYQTALDIDSDNVRNYVNLAIAYRQSGDNETAESLYLEALDIDPDYPELNSSLGSLYLLEDDAETAIEYFNKAIDKDPELSEAWGNGALAYAMVGDFETAEEYLDTAVENGYQNADTIREMIEKEKAG